MKLTGVMTPGIVGVMTPEEALTFPAPCPCTDPKGHNLGCPSDPGDDYVKFARVEQRSYLGEDYDLAMSRGLPRNRVERGSLRGMSNSTANRRCGGLGLTSGPS